MRRVRKVTVDVSRVPLVDVHNFCLVYGFELEGTELVIAEVECR